MIIGFVIWSLVSLVLLGIGFRTWRSGKAAGFWSGIRPPEVDDVRAYNHSVAILWFVYAALFECLGLPFLFLKQNAGGFIWTLLCVPVLSLMLMVAYHRILEKHRVRRK